MSRLCAPKSERVYAEVLPTDTVLIAGEGGVALELPLKKSMPSQNPAYDSSTGEDSSVESSSIQIDTEGNANTVLGRGLTEDSESSSNDEPLLTTLPTATQPIEYDAGLSPCSYFPQNIADAKMLQACANFLDQYDSVTCSESNTPTDSPRTLFSEELIPPTHVLSQPSVQEGNAAIDFTPTLIKFGKGFLKSVPEIVVREMRADDEAIAQRFMIDGDVGEQIAQKIAAIYSKFDNTTHDIKPIIMELTACCGGSVLQFAASGLFSRVDAIEKDPTRCKYLEHNYKLLRDQHLRLNLCPLQIVNADLTTIKDIDSSQYDYYKLDTEQDEIPGQIFDKNQTAAQILFYDPIWMNMFPDDLFPQIELSSKKDRQEDSQLVVEIGKILNDFDVKNSRRLFAVKCPRASFAIDDIVSKFSDSYTLLYHELKKMTVVYFLPNDSEIKSRFDFKETFLEPLQDCAWINIGTLKPNNGTEVILDKHTNSYLDENKKLTLEGRNKVLQNKSITSDMFFLDGEYYYRPELGTKTNTLYRILKEDVIRLYQENVETAQSLYAKIPNSNPSSDKILEWVSSAGLQEKDTKLDLLTIFGIASGAMKANYSSILRTIDKILHNTTTNDAFKRMIWFFMRAILVTPSRDDQAARLRTFNELFKKKLRNTKLKAFTFHLQTHKPLYLQFIPERQIMFSTLQSSSRKLSTWSRKNIKLDYEKLLDRYVKKKSNSLDAKNYFYTAPFRDERTINQHDGQCKLAHAHCEFLYDHVYSHFFEDNQTIEKFHQKISHLKLVYVGAANTKKPSGEVWTIYKQSLHLRPELKIVDSDFLTMLKMNNVLEFQLPAKIIKIEPERSYRINAWIQPFSMLSHFYRYNGHNLWHYVDPSERQTLSMDTEIKNDPNLINAFEPFKPQPKVRSKLYCQYAMLRKKYAAVQAKIQDGSWLELFGNKYVASGTRSERYLADFLKLFPTGDILLIDPQAINEVELRQDLGMHAGDGRLEVRTQSFTTDMCIQLAQSCRTLGTYWQECDEPDTNEATPELRELLTKSRRIRIEKLEGLKLNITRQTVVRVKASGLSWQLEVADNEIETPKENIIRIYSKDKPNWEFFMNTLNSVTMTVEEQVEFGALLNGIAIENRVVKLENKVWTCQKDENGQNLIWSIEESGTVNQTFQNILSSNEANVDDEVLAKFKQKFIIPKKFVFLTEEQMKDLHLHEITDSTRVKVAGYSFYWTPQRKSRALKPVLQTPVFISDARKDTVIRDKSIETAAVHALAKTIQSEKVQPPDFLPFLEYVPKQNSNRHIFVGPIFNAFFYWNTRRARWLRVPLWHTSKTQKTAVVKINEKYYQAKRRVQQAFSSPPQIENIQIKSGDKVYVAHLGVFQYDDADSSNQWNLVSSRQNFRFPNRVIGPIEGLYYNTIQQWEEVSEKKSIQNYEQFALQNCIIGPIGDGHYYEKRKDSDEWQKISIDDEVFEDFQKHLKQGKSLQDFKPFESKGCTIGPYDGFYYHYDRFKNQWSRDSNLKDSVKDLLPVTTAFKKAIQTACDKVEMPGSGLDENSVKRCKKGVESLVFSALVNAEETCASYVNNAIWLLILAGFFHGDDKVGCFANIKTSLTTFAAVAPRLPLLFDTVSEGKEIVEKLIGSGLISEFLPSSAEGFGCRPHAMESRHWVSLGMSMNSKYKKFAPESLDQVSTKLRERIKEAITCKTIFMSMTEMRVLPEGAEIEFYLFSSGQEPQGMLNATEDFERVRDSVFKLKETSLGLPRFVSPDAATMVYVKVGNEYFVPANLHVTFEQIKPDLISSKIGTKQTVSANTYEKLILRDYAQKKILDHGRTPWVPTITNENCPSQSEMSQRVRDLLNKRLSLIAVNSMNTTPKSQPTLPRFEQKLEAIAIYDRILELWYRGGQQGQESQAKSIENCVRKYLNRITNTQKKAAQSYEKLTWEVAINDTIYNFYRQQKSMIQWRDKLVGPFWLTGYIFPEHIQKIFEMLYWMQIDEADKEDVQAELEKYFADLPKQHNTAFAAILQTLKYGTRDLPYVDLLRNEITKFLGDKLDSATIYANLIPENYRMHIQDYAYSESTRGFLSRVETELAKRFYNYLPLAGAHAKQKYLTESSLVRWTRQERKSKKLQEIPVNMWGSFDVNRVFLYAQKSVHEWPSGDIGRKRERDVSNPGSGFFALHRIIENDMQDLLTAILKSSAFGYKKELKREDRIASLTSSDAKNQPSLFSTVQEKEAAWKQCIAIITDFSVPRCAEKLVLIFVQRQIEYESKSQASAGDLWPVGCLQRIRQDLKLRSRITKTINLKEAIKNEKSIVADMKRVFPGYFQWWNDAEMPGSGEFFGQKFMSSLCSNQTVKPFEFRVHSGEDFMNSWIFLLYFCEEIRPVELFCCIYHVCKSILENISSRISQIENEINRIQRGFNGLRDNVTDADRENQAVYTAEQKELKKFCEEIKILFSAKDKNFKFNIEKFLDYDWMNLLFEEIDKDKKKQSTLMLDALAWCVMLKDNIERFEEGDGFKQEKEWLFHDDDGFTRV